MTINPKLTWATTRHALSVPEITFLFWVLKWLSTALGESTSDYLVHAMPPVVAVLLGFVAFIAALAVQFSRRRYQPWAYWLAVVMVGVFGTMAADVLHVGFGVPYIASTVLYGAALAVVFYTWQRTERTLSIHSIDTPRREAFYSPAVVATFALGTSARRPAGNHVELWIFRVGARLCGDHSRARCRVLATGLEPGVQLLVRVRCDASVGCERR